MLFLIYKHINLYIMTYYVYILNNKYIIIVQEKIRKCNIPESVG